ncbi:MAG: histidinol-phosphatase HisJ [Candidatus Omnitrophota bacterium]
MTPICDYHMHTFLCGHADGQPHEYAEQAIKVGLKEIGFSDHAPLLSHRDPSITMDIGQLPEYQRLIEHVRQDYRKKIKIKVGIEADFLPGYENQTKELLAGYPYDYVIGSVHFIKGWAFDNPDEKVGWKQKDTNAVYSEYYDCLRRCAQTGLFDIMAHVDLVKKFGHRPTEDFTGEIEKTAQVFKKCGVVIEINTSGLRKPAKEIYPEPKILKIYREAGVPLTFGSDAHEPADVARDFDKAVQLAKRAGYQKYVLFRRRKIEKVVAL